MIVTPLTEMFGLKHPIVLGPMDSVSGGHLAATASNAGELGLVGGGYGENAWLRTESRVKEETSRPWAAGSSLPPRGRCVTGYVSRTASCTVPSCCETVQKVNAFCCHLALRLV